MNPRALGVMLAAVGAAAVGAAATTRPGVGVTVFLVGLGIIGLGAFVPGGSFVSRTADDKRNDLLIKSSLDAILVLDSEGIVQFANPAIATIFGWSRADFEGHPLIDYMDPDEHDNWINLLDRIGRIPGAVERTEGRVAGADGVFRPVEISIANRSDDESLAGFVVNFRDNSERRRTENTLASRVAQQSAVARLGRFALEGADPSALAEEAARIIRDTLDVDACEVYRAIVDDGVLALEAAAGSTFMLVGQFLQEMGPNSLAGYTLLQDQPVISDDLERERRFRVSAHERNHGFSSGVGVVLTGRSRRYGVMWAASNVRRGFTGDDTAFLQSVANALALALERRGVEAEARHAALHDALTGLPNRSLFMDRLRLALERATDRREHLAVLFIDLDHFKVVNDSLGHGAGDGLLIGVADRLQRVLRPGDTVARFGGDEYTILCQDLDHPEQVEAIVDRVRAALDEPFEIEGSAMRVTASIGITLVDTAVDEVSAETVLRDADAAMYQAKSSGRARFEIFDDSMRIQVVERFRTESELRAAVEEDTLDVHYQSIVDLRRGRTVGVEALVRWQHPTRGLITPSHFIPIAEETDLIDLIGDWVLRKAAAQVSIWNERRDEPMTVSVNLSARQLHRPDVVNSVQRILEDTGANPAHIWLEITESALMHDVSASMSTLWGLRELGVGLAVDDFGTGYSSLSYLKRLPVDILKIDHSFVDGLGRNREDRAIAAAVVNLAHTLGLRSTAEGVETERQQAVLFELGCDLAQGYLYSEPMPASELDTTAAWPLSHPPTTDESGPTAEAGRAV